MRNSFAIKHFAGQTFLILRVSCSYLLHTHRDSANHNTPCNMFCTITSGSCFDPTTRHQHVDRPISSGSSAQTDTHITAINSSGYRLELPFIIINKFRITHLSSIQRQPRPPSTCHSQPPSLVGFVANTITTATTLHPLHH